MVMVHGRACRPVTGNLVRDNFGPEPNLSLNILFRTDHFLVLFETKWPEFYFSVCEQVCATFVVRYEYN